MLLTQAPGVVRSVTVLDYPARARTSCRPARRRRRPISAALIPLCSISLPIEAAKHWRIVDSLPKNSAGKVLKRELRERFRKQEPATS